MTLIKNFLLCLSTLSIIDAHLPLNERPPDSEVEPELRNFQAEAEESAFNENEDVAKKSKNGDYRLPKNVNPELYELHLTIPKEVFQNEESNEFSGILKLTFTLKDDTNEIKIHGNKLKIEEIALEEVVSNRPKIDLVRNGYDSDPETDIIIITTISTLSKVKKYQLIFKYKGQIRAASEMQGLYKSYYQDQHGRTVYLVTTQFQPVHARKVFPCLDEPSFKAEFEINVTHPKDLTAFSNTPPQTQESGQSATTTFDKTPKMSTYLVALVVSEFTCTTEANLAGNLKHEVCSRPEAASARDYAAKIGPKIMKSLEDFTGITYAESKIGKMHQFGIPDFDAGAMENWGLCIYKETSSLWDPVESSNSHKQKVGTVITHEFAHQWFGNLVTTHWWSDTFLNEGFARYLQYFITLEVEDKWELDKQFVIEQQQLVMQMDASSATHAVSYPDVYTPENIDKRFNRISYSKGASIVRMISLILGRENFKKALQKYLKNHKYSNTQPSDLLNALNEFVPRDRLPKSIDFQTVMKNWIEKPGFPLVTVKIEGSNLKISQQRYLRSGKPSNDEKWFVPITLTTSSDTNKFEKTTPDKWLLPSEDLTIPIKNLGDKTTWVVLNNQQAGYYRVDYDDALWKRIEVALKSDNFGGIGELNRAQIADDIFNFVKDGKRDVAKLFEIFDYLSNEDSYYAWYRVSAAINTILSKTSAPEIQEKLRSRFSEWLQKVYKSVPFSKAKDDDQIYTFKRVLVQKYACRLGNKECIENALDVFKKYKGNAKKVDKNLRQVVYCEALRHSKTPKKDFEFLWGEYKKTKVSTETVTILESLGCSKDPETLKKIFDLVLDPSSGIRAQEVKKTYSGIYTHNQENVDVALDYIIENPKKISNSRVSLTELIGDVAGSFTSEKQIAKLGEFAKRDGLNESVIRVISTSIKDAESHLAWTTKFEGSVRKILEDDTTTPVPTKSSNSRYTGQIEVLSSLLVGVLLYFKLMQ